jgi:hypothetical protein
MWLQENVLDAPQSDAVDPAQSQQELVDVTSTVNHYIHLQENARTHHNAMQQHGVPDPHTIANLTPLADGHIGSNLAVGADLRIGVQDNIALKAWPLRQLAGIPLAQGTQVELQTCATAPLPS